MTMTKISFIGVLFVVIIIYLGAHLVNKFDLIDLGYMLFMIGSFIKFIYIRKVQSKR